jgi:RHS repeat-associated protein
MQKVDLSPTAPAALQAGAGRTWYLHGDNNDLFYEVEQKTNGITEYKHYLSAGGIVFAMQVSRSGTLAAGNATVGNNLASSLRYFHHDHQGSTIAVTNEAGAVIERMAFDPWGKRRNVNGLIDASDSINGLTTDRGYTGHEHLDEMGIIHMNGRVYDPLIGRFMSADPFIQAPDMLQSYNRYAYVMNNPLNLTDPSGYWSFKSFFRSLVREVVVRTVLAIADVTFCAGYCTLAYNAYNGYKSGGVPGLIASFIPGSENAWANAATNAGKGCVVAAANGGSCGQGAASSVVRGLGGDSLPGNMLAGCVAARINGGGCGDGASNAFISYAAEHVAESAVIATTRSAQERANRRSQTAAAPLIGAIALVLPEITAADLLIGASAAAGVFSIGKIYDSLVYRSSYRERALNASGIPKEDWDNYDVHHVVARGDGRAALGRAGLFRVGIGIDDNENLAPLLRTQHSGVHTNLYHQTVSAQVWTASDFGRLAVSTTLMTIRTVLTVRGRYP